MKIIILLISLISAQLFAQQTFRPNPFSKTLVIGFEAGPTYSFTDYSKREFDYAGKFLLETYFKTDERSSFGIRSIFNVGFLTASDNSIFERKFRTRFSSVGLGIVYLLEASNIFYPFVSVGTSYIWFEPKDINGNLMKNYLNKVYKPKEINFSGDFGTRIRLTDNLTLSVSGGVQISPYDNLDDLQKGTSNDMFFVSNFGLTYSLFTEMDSDRDGVSDSKDKCAFTPLGVVVDEFGCPFDSDNDGIYDYKDKCPNTPRGVNVDQFGCPIDSDNDGVADYKDLCPDTPFRIKVDDFGCPFDSDNDGIADYLDKCPDTPTGVDVDNKGCPIDSDLDGIPDFRDNCPDSAPGEIVDDKGCKKISQIKSPPVDTVKVDPKPILEFTFSVSDLFEKNGITLKQSAFFLLDEVFEEMKREPISRWEIQSYTDNVGKPDVNLKTSIKRAESIENYFLSKGIAQIRLESVGFGSKFPIADNKTEAGRNINRRIVIKRINKP